MSVPTTSRRLTPRASPAERTRTPVDGVDVLGALSPEPGRRLHDLPAALPLPHHRPAARAVLARRRARHRGAQGARGPLRPARRRAHPRAGPRPAGPGLGRAARDGAASSPRCSAARVPRRRLADLLPRGRSTATSRWRTHAASSRPSASSTSRRSLDSKLLLRGFVDRVDVAPDGRDPGGRLQDRAQSPASGFEAKALFQMKFYALVIWRTRGVVPAMLQLIYLGNGEMLRYEPDEHDLLATERKVEAVWRAIQRRRRRPVTGVPSPSPALRLVRPPGDLPGVGRHAASRCPSAVAGADDPSGDLDTRRRASAASALTAVRRRARRRPRRRRRGAAPGPRPRGTETATPSPSSLDRRRRPSSSGSSGSSVRIRSIRARTSAGGAACRAGPPCAGVSRWSRSPTRACSASYSSASRRVQCSSISGPEVARLPATDRRRLRAAGVEGAAQRAARRRRGSHRGAGRAGRIRSGSGSGIAFSSAFVYGCRGLAKISSVGADLDDPAEVHDRDPVAEELRGGQVVGDVDVAEAQLLLEVEHQLQDLGPHAHVEHRDRLVGDQHARGP